MFVRKPLDSAAGGAGKGHKGTDLWGHNVYRTEDDVAYKTLVAWAKTKSSARDEDDDSDDRANDDGSDDSTAQDDSRSPDAGRARDAGRGRDARVTP